MYGPLEKQQAPPSPSRPGTQTPSSLPLFTSGSGAEAWANDCASLRPLRHFIAPSPTSPTPRLPGQREGEGKQTVIGRKPPRPSGGCAPRRRRNPALRTA